MDANCPNPRRGFLRSTSLLMISLSLAVSLSAKKERLRLSFPPSTTFLLPLAYSSRSAAGLPLPGLVPTRGKESSRLCCPVCRGRTWASPLCASGMDTARPSLRGRSAPNWFLLHQLAGAWRHSAHYTTHVNVSIKG